MIIKLCYKKAMVTEHVNKAILVEDKDFNYTNVQYNMTNTLLNINYLYKFVMKIIK